MTVARGTKGEVPLFDRLPDEIVRAVFVFLDGARDAPSLLRTDRRLRGIARDMAWSEIAVPLDPVLAARAADAIRRGNVRRAGAVRADVSAGPHVLDVLKALGAAGAGLREARLAASHLSQVAAAVDALGGGVETLEVDVAGPVLRTNGAADARELGRALGSVRALVARAPPRARVAFAPAGLLAAARGVRDLRLERFAFDDAAFEALAAMPALVRLELAPADIARPYECLRALRGGPLEALVLASHEAGDGSVLAGAGAGLPRLRRLRIRHLVADLAALDPEAVARWPGAPVRLELDALAVGRRTKREGAPEPDAALGELARWLARLGAGARFALAVTELGGERAARLVGAAAGRLRSYERTRMGAPADDAGVEREVDALARCAPALERATLAYVLGRGPDRPDPLVRLRGVERLARAGVRTTVRVGFGDAGAEAEARALAARLGALPGVSVLVDSP